MKTYSGSTSEGFLPATLPVNGAAATSVAPAPEDPSATFADALDQQTPKTLFASAWPAPSAPAALDPASVVDTTPLAPAGSDLFYPAAPAWKVSSAPGSTSPAPLLGQPAVDLTGPSSLSYAWLGKAVTTPVSPNPASDPTAPAPLPLAKASFLSSGPASSRLTSATSAGFSLHEEETDLTSTKDPSAPALGTARAAQPSRAGSAARPSADLSSRCAFTCSTWITPSPAPAATPVAPSSATPAEPASPVENDSIWTGSSTSGRALAATLPAPSLTSPAPSTFPTLVAMPAGSPLATIMAHAAILAAAKSPAGSVATSQSTAAVAACATIQFVPDKTPFAGLSKPPSTTSTSEKKSAASPSERSFLQDGTSAPAPADMVASLLLASVIPPSHAIEDQSLVTSSTSSVELSGRPAAAAISGAGMANGKKMEDMNSTLEMTSLVLSSGTHPLVNRASADLHIALASNSDFSDALHQVMHVVELSNMSRSTPPLRVAIEIQTPPGAIVNVYVSRQSDSSYRAQLSTNDPQALAWVQNQVGSLKGSTDSGSAIRWSPAQLEPGTASLSTSSSSTGGDRSYDWDRGGQQGQSGYQDEPRAPRLPQLDESDEAEAVFATAFGALGGLA